MTTHLKDFEEKRDHGLRSVWRICEVCKTEFLSKTAKICYECKRRIEQESRRGK